jgi:hypothetical protein
VRIGVFSVLTEHTATVEGLAASLDGCAAPDPDWVLPV